MPSPNGGPPRSSSRTGSSYAVTVTRSLPGGAYASSSRPTSTASPADGSSRTRPASTSTPCSYDASTSSGSDAPGSSSTSAPSSGVNVATGDVSPSSEPRNTRACQPGPVTG